MIFYRVLACAGRADGGKPAAQSRARRFEAIAASPTRKTAGARRSGRRESLKKVLERNLILEGLSPAEAKELVQISAA